MGQTEKKKTVIGSLLKLNLRDVIELFKSHPKETAVASLALVGIGVTAGIGAGLKNATTTEKAEYEHANTTSSYVAFADVDADKSVLETMQDEYGETYEITMGDISRVEDLSEATAASEEVVEDEETAEESETTDEEQDEQSDGKANGNSSLLDEFNQAAEKATNIGGMDEAENPNHSPEPDSEALTPDATEKTPSNTTTGDLVEEVEKVQTNVANKYQESHNPSNAETDTQLEKGQPNHNINQDNMLKVVGTGTGMALAVAAAIAGIATLGAVAAKTKKRQLDRTTKLNANSSDLDAIENFEEIVQQALIATDYNERREEILAQIRSAHEAVTNSSLTEKQQGHYLRSVANTSDNENHERAIRNTGNSKISQISREQRKYRKKAQEAIDGVDFNQPGMNTYYPNNSKLVYTKTGTLAPYSLNRSASCSTEIDDICGDNLQEFITKVNNLSPVSTRKIETYSATLKTQNGEEIEISITFDGRIEEACQDALLCEVNKVIGARKDIATVTLRQTTQDNRGTHVSLPTTYNTNVHAETLEGQKTPREFLAQLNTAEKRMKIFNDIHENGRSSAKDGRSM